MAVSTQKIDLNTRGNDECLHITGKVQTAVKDSKVKNGIATVFVSGSTAGVTTIEFEPGLLEDIRAAVERLAPKGIDYGHHRTAGDDNGHSHIRASLFGPSLTVPVIDGELALGTWQQIILMDFDTHPRSRTITVQIIGE